MTDPVRAQRDLAVAALPTRGKPYLTEKEILAGAKFYARASAQRAMHGVIPNWDDEADEAYWRRTRPDTRKGCLDMVRGIVVACEFKRHQEAAFERAKAILARVDRDEDH